MNNNDELRQDIANMYDALVTGEYAGEGGRDIYIDQSMQLIRSARLDELERSRGIQSEADYYQRRDILNNQKKGK